MENEKEKQNHLKGESSPYLVQHADNPVDWYPWGEEALEKARLEDKPIFLSIGYSACHWCHVMAHESFENREIAEYINDNFVSIKVDREERPDIDHVYMQAVQAMTGRGGWPLTVFLSPDGKPFFGGTYFPPENRQGMPGLVYVLKAMKQAYVDSRDEILDQSRELQSALSNVAENKMTEPSAAVLDDAVRKMSADIDRLNGGFGTVPKFPEPMALEFLLHMYRHKNDRTLLEMVELTLDNMARGGIYDQLGGGFHRYSTDNMWRVPHFEKMLYDNALLGSLYTHAFQVTKKHVYGKIACETLNFLLREMRSAEGGFYSTLDADSESVEGKYYLWSETEIENSVGKETAGKVSSYYHATAKGNFESSNILYVTDSDGEPPAKVKEAMFSSRNKRVRPGRDEKIIASWNGLAIRSLAEASAVFGREDYLQAAASCAHFVTDKMIAHGKLPHTYKDGLAGPDGYLEDHACIIQGLLGMHAVTLSSDWLNLAVKLTDEMIELFLDQTDGYLYDNRHNSEQLFIRPRNLVDGATPCGNSSAVSVLLHMYALTHNGNYERIADKAFDAVSKQMRILPRGFGNWLCALDFHTSSPLEIVICSGYEARESGKAIEIIFNHYLPNMVVTGIGSHNKNERRMNILDGKSAIDGRTTVYICRDRTCQSPITELEQLNSELDNLEIR